MNRSSVLVRAAAVSTLMLSLALGTVEIERADAESSSHDLSHQAEDAKTRAAEARAQEQALAGDIAAQSERIDAVEGEVGVLRYELARLEGELDRSKSLLRALENELAEKNRTLARASREIGVAQRHLSRRVVEIYTSDQPDGLAVALGAKSLDDLIDALDVQSRVIEQDASLVQEITTLQARVTRERTRTRTLRQKRATETARLEGAANDRRSALATLVARRDSLTDLRSARQRSLASVQVQRRAWEAQASALQAQSTRVASIAVTPAAPAPSSDAHVPTLVTSSTGGFIWPVRGTLVSPFGERWGRLHSGIDIAAPAGTAIAASASGQVVYASSMSGYGLMVVIQHAGGIATAYAHNSSISVSVGQSVSQGQTIAAVGCTGHCFGDHVHFEIRVGGSPVDPMGYL